MGSARLIRLCLLAVVPLAGCGDAVTLPLEPEPPPPAVPSEARRLVDRGMPEPASDVPVLVGAGDIADCGSQGDEWTADLLDGIDGTVVTFGDNVYEAGSIQEFRRCYHPSWGRHRDRTLPSVGNHEYLTPLATGYFAYFGARAGPRLLGYYSYDLAGWHVVVLNSMTEYVDQAAQRAWLIQDLARNPTLCTVAYFHHPRFSSGTSHGDQLQMQPIWTILYEQGVDVVLNGHDHHYERWAPQDAFGAHDPEYGVREFIVGTGGRSLRGYVDGRPNSEFRYNANFGVLKLTLEEAGYSWEFIATDGASTSIPDSGSGACHGLPPVAAVAYSTRIASTGSTVDARLAGR